MKKVGIIILALVYLLSGGSKAFDINGFKDVLEGYSLPFVSALSPIVALGEFALGVALLIGFQRKVMLRISLYSLSCFTLIFAYANLVLGVTDCGCFGEDMFNFSPLMTYIRNILLIGLNIYLLKKVPLLDKKYLKPITLSILTVLLMIVSFIAGKSSEFSDREYVGEYIIKSTGELNLHDNVNKTFLSENIVFSKDTTYLIGVMSYSCKACDKTAALLNNFTNSNLKVKTYAFMRMSTEEKIAEFYERVNPNFSIINLNKASMKRLSIYYPKIIAVKNNEITGIFNDLRIDLAKLNKKE